MTAAPEASAIYQLIGRIIYFHVLFIEPALSRPDQGSKIIGNGVGASCSSRSVIRVLVGDRALPYLTMLLCLSRGFFS
jgi:hypothetical protein